jgi:hypothetical protein
MFDEFLSKADPVAIPHYERNAIDLQAQAAGVKGARQGGFARAESLTPKRRRQIAKKAASARWKKHPH